MDKSIIETLEKFKKFICFHAGKSLGDTLILDFGKKVNYESSRGGGVHGAWALIIESNWFLYENNNLLTSRDSTKASQYKFIKLLEDKNINNINIAPGYLQTVFRFDAGITLHVPVSKNKGRWLLYTPTDKVLECVLGKSLELIDKNSPY